MIIIVASCSMICFVSFNAVKGMVDPKEAKKIYYKIVDSKPLPASRYKFSGGLNIDGTLMLATVEDRKEHQQFVLTRVQDDKKQIFKGNTLTSERIREIINSRTGKATNDVQFSEFKDGGSVKIGDQEVSFNIGVVMVDGKKVDRQLIGAVCPEDGVMTLVQAVAHDPNGSFDMKTTKEFLSYLKRFK